MFNLDHVEMQLLYKKVSRKISWFQIRRLRSSLISVFRSITDRGKNHSIWSPLYMLFLLLDLYRWIYIVRFGWMELSYLKYNCFMYNFLHEYIMYWFDICAPVIDSMTIWIWYICFNHISNWNWYDKFNMK